ncbi:MAG: hypothetical protein ACK41C_10520 [Phenylobacterium sp.]|uniref:hypothetical protein n=1 Tax=Phenylobacterium sp. TaxID=1871053 RepID=UPI00391DD3DD
MPTYIANSAAELAGLVAGDASAGDTIQLAPSATSYGILNLSASSVNELVIEAQTVGAGAFYADLPAWHPANFNRTAHISQLRIDGSRSLHLRNLAIRFPGWPTLGQTWPEWRVANPEFLQPASVILAMIHPYNSGSGDLILDGVMGVHGYGPDHEPYDTTRFYEDDFSSTDPQWVTTTGFSYPDASNGGNPRPGHGSAFCAYNRIGNGPQFMQGDGGLRTGKLTTIDLLLSDVRGAFSKDRFGDILHRRPVLNRLYKDAFISLYRSAYPGQKVVVEQPLFWEAFADPRDSGDPHQDFWQGARVTADAAPSAYVHHGRVAFIQPFMARRPVTRGKTAQAVHYRAGKDSASGGIIFRRFDLLNPVLLSDDSPYGIKAAYLEDAYIVAPFLGTNPGRTAGTTPTVITSYDVTSERKGGVALFERGIIEGSITAEPGAPAPYRVDTCLYIGPRGSKIPYASLVQGGDVINAPGPLNSPEAVWNAYRRKPAFQAWGPPDMDLETFLTGPLITSNLRPFAGWREVNGAELGQMVVGKLSRVRGPQGAVLPLTDITDMEIEVVAEDGVTIVTPWTSEDITVPVEHYIRPRRLSAAAHSTTVQGTADLAGTPLTFRITTRSANDFPGVQFDGTDSLNTAGPTVLDSEDTGKLVMYLNFRFDPATIPTTIPVSRGAQQRALRLQLVNTKVIRAVLANSSGAIVFQMSTPELTNGRRYQIWMSADLDAVNGLGEPDPANGSRGAMLDELGTFQQFSHSTWTAGGRAQWTYNQTGSGYQFGGDGSNFFQGTLFAYVVDNRRFLDVLDPEIRGRFSPDLIGDNGEGIFPGEDPPLIVFLGRDSDYNHVDGINRGRGPKFKKVGSTALTPVDSNVWPPVHTLSLELLSEGPLLVGQPVLFRVDVSGYAPSGTTADLSSNNTGVFDADPVVLPEGTNGVVVEYTPEIAGEHEITISHATYASGDPLVISVAEAWTIVEPGQSAAFTAAEARKEEFEGTDQEVGQRPGATFSWKDGPGEAGDTEELEVYANVVA